MENKKSQKSDLSKRSTMFFQLGLIIALLLVWQLMEWKMDAGNKPEIETLAIDGFEEEVVPVTEVPEEKLPELPKEAIEEIDIIDDNLDKPEDLIAPTETTEEPARVEEIEVIDKPEEIEDHSMLSVEEVPVYLGCEGLTTNDQKRDCMSDKMKSHVNRIFDTSIGEELGLSGIYRIYVSFKIEPTGKVTIIGARGPHSKLEAEAVRVAEKLPEMQPGRHGGKAVGVTYSLPIVFRIQN